LTRHVADAKSISQKGAIVKDDSREKSNWKIAASMQ
jgi:hypothetical protein